MGIIISAKGKTTYGPPSIVTDGLVLYLDAGNHRSFPGTSNMWYDLTTNKNNVIFAFPPPFSSENGGNIGFDSNQAAFSIPNLQGIVTIEMWAKIDANYKEKMFMGWLYYDVYTGGNGHLGFNTGNSDLYGINSGVVENLNIINNWAHYVFEMRSDISYTNNKMYINSEQQSLSQILSSEAVSYRNFNNGYGAIGAPIGYNSNYCMLMNCAVFKIYNRSLSQSEITQNYNALKSRY
jgi:hypothetical protein